MAASNSDLIKHFGDQDLKSSGTGNVGKAAEILGNKVVLLYFSASWCGPCQQFSPLLKSLYNKLKDKKGNEDFEIVFCSLDRTDDTYRQYTSGMPWYCLPFSSPIITKLGTTYAGGQLAIPLLVVLDKEGTIILNDAVEKVTDDPQGAKFPWRPPPIVQVLPDLFLDRSNNLLPMSDLDDKYILLYFSAHWCPPCRKFTPILSKAYTELKKHRNDFEFLFVSSDRNQASFDEYFGEMSFHAIPYQERDTKAALSQRFQVTGIPASVMLGPVQNGDRAIINQNFHAIFGGDYVEDFPFHPKRYGDLSTTKDNINKFRSVVIFHEMGDDDEQDDIKNSIKAASDQCEDKSVHFYWGNQPIGLTKVLKDILKIGNDSQEPVMAMIDVPNQSYYMYEEKLNVVSADSILAFVSNPGKKNMFQE